MSGLFAMARSQMLIGATRPITIVTGIFTPLLWLSLILLPRLESLSPQETTQMLCGTLLASFWASSLWSGSGIIRRERWAGTLAASFTGRINPHTVLIGKTLGSVLFDVATISATIITFSLACRVSVSVADPLAFAVGLLSVILGGLASSLMIGGLLMVTKYAAQLTLAFGSPVLLFAGTLVPYTLLPDWVEWVGSILNISWLQRFLSSIATGTRWEFLLIALALSAVYAGIGSWAFALLLRRARREASLELV